MAWPNITEDLISRKLIFEWQNVCFWIRKHKKEKKMTCSTAMYLKPDEISSINIDQSRYQFWSIEINLLQFNSVCYQHLNFL